MKKNISIITLSGLLIYPSAFALKVTFEDIEPKSFEEFTKPQKPVAVPQPPKVVGVTPTKATAVPTPKPDAPVKAVPVPKVEAVKANTQTASTLNKTNNKTLVIGDSLSSSYGKFGPGIAEALSKNGNEACLYSVSGSRFDQWAGNYPMKNPSGSNATYFKDGKGNSKSFSKNDPAPQNWNLAKLLASHSCGNPEKKFTHLVIQLGSNHSEEYSPVKDLDKIFALAKENGIQDIKFILPPDAVKYKHQELCNKIKFYLSKEHGVRSSFFDTVNRVTIQNKDLEDGVHFYNTSSEKNWTTSVQGWIENSNRATVEQSIKENSHNRTVSN
jgi:hypothetical protein